MKQKAVYNTIFLLLVIILMTLPFLLTFNQVLTNLMEKFRLYKELQDFVVPVQVRIVTLLIRPLGIKPITYVNGFMINGTFLEMTWNCVGWQSLFLLGLTLLVGFKNGVYTLTSKLEAVVIGILGTFLVNLLRLAVIVVIFAYLRPIYGIVYHDYLAAIVTSAWLIYFWSFSYKFILEERSSNRSSSSLGT